MRIIDDIAQGSDAWKTLRIGRPTASEFKNILTPGFKLRTGDMFKSYVYAKAAEAFSGKVQRDSGSWQMDNGTMLEPEARAWFEFEHGQDIRLTAFVESKDGRCGCSPDGLIGDDGGIEIKCPMLQTHIGYLDEGVLPDAYALQVHGSMFVTGRKWWKFLSYNRTAPAFLIHVERNEEICAKIGAALDEFYRHFDAVMVKLQQAK